MSAIRLMRLLAALVAVAAAFALAACGDDSDDGSASATTSAAPAPASEPEGEPEAGPIENPFEMPTARAHRGGVDRLVVRDVTVGDGMEIMEGDTALVDYYGALYETGRRFDSSWDAGQPVEFPIAPGVIEGWVQGIPGMRVGGRRILVIPPELGYGEQGTGGIPPNSTLYFVVDLLGVRAGGY